MDRADAEVRLSGWAAENKVGDNMTWVGRDYSLKQAKADVRALLQSTPSQDPSPAAYYPWGIDTASGPEVTYAEELTAAAWKAAHWLPYHEPSHPEYEGERSDVGRALRAALAKNPINGGGGTQAPATVTASSGQQQSPAPATALPSPTNRSMDSEPQTFGRWLKATARDHYTGDMRALARAAWMAATAAAQSTPSQCAICGNGCGWLNGDPCPRCSPKKD